jgi:DNA-directed RNA polymerase specialized sigma24 family protein
VDLLRAYSNHSGLLEDLNRAVRRLEQAATGDRQDWPRSVSSIGRVGRVGRVWALSERLSDDQVRAMVTKFRAGTSKQELADEYGISPKSVQRLMRREETRQ